MPSPLISGHAYDVTFDPDGEETAELLCDLVFEDSLDGFYIFREPASDLDEYPGRATLSAEGVAPAEGDRIFLNRGWIRKIREHQVVPVAPAAWIAAPAPAEAATDVDTAEMPDGSTP